MDVPPPQPQSQLAAPSSTTYVPARSFASLPTNLPPPQGLTVPSSSSIVGAFTSPPPRIFEPQPTEIVVAKVLPPLPNFSVPPPNFGGAINKSPNIASSEPTGPTEPKKNEFAGAWETLLKRKEEVCDSKF